jgi:hypothetical protein
MTAPEKLSKLYPPHTEPVGDGLYDDAGQPHNDGLYDVRAGGGDRWTSLFDPPLVPAPRGLFDAVTWLQDGTLPLRFLDGLQVRQQNIGVDGQFGVWDEDWCDAPDSASAATKIKERPDAVIFDVEPITVYAYDHNQCGDMTGTSRAEVRQRAIHVMTLTEQVSVETSVAARLLADAPTAVPVTSVTAAVSELEVALAKAGLMGYLHASPKWAAYLAESRLNLNGRSPLGHTWVFGGGYADPLGDTIVATTQLFGWRGPMAVRDAIKLELNQYIAIAERSMAIAYEAAVAAVKVG